jgi:hypothetical protein
LLEAAEAAEEEEEGHLLRQEVHSLVTRVLSEAALRMRETAKSLARNLLEMPYFADHGPLAAQIHQLVKERRGDETDFGCELVPGT